MYTHLPDRFKQDRLVCWSVRLARAHCLDITCCTSVLQQVPFATTGFDGIVHTDEDIAGLATVDLDADAGKGAVSSSAGSKAHGSSKKSSVRKGHAKGSKQQAIPTAGAVPAPGRKPSRKGRRKCRESKRWGAC